MKDLVPDIALIGMSHRTAPVSIRELLVVPEDDRKEFYDQIRSLGVEEMVYITTCNRTEIYLASFDIESSENRVHDFLCRHTGLDRESFSRNAYEYISHDAVRHLFRVTSSMDSMVVGENEITGQVKAGYREAVELKATGTVLNRLFHLAFRAAKRVRSETDISRNPLSIASIAAEKAKSVFPDFNNREALLIGAGEMGELILRYLYKLQIGSIVLANRSMEKARQISETLGIETEIIGLQDLEEKGPRSDIIISSVTAPHHLITATMARSIMELREGRPLFIIDIAVPRNVDPGAGDMDGLHLFNVDDLQSTADDHLQKRKVALDKAELVIRETVEEFYDWYHEQAAVPTISLMRKSFDEIRNAELERYRVSCLSHLSEEDFETVRGLTRQIMRKTLHNPITNLKQRHKKSIQDYCMDDGLKEKTEFIKELFCDEDA